MVDRVAAMLNYFLTKLVGPKRNELKVNQLYFTPSGWWFLYYSDFSLICHHCICRTFHLPQFPSTVTPLQSDTQWDLRIMLD